MSEVVAFLCRVNFSSTVVPQAMGMFTKNVLPKSLTRKKNGELQVKFQLFEKFPPLLHGDRDELSITRQRINTGKRYKKEVDFREFLSFVMQSKEKLLWCKLLAQLARCSRKGKYFHGTNIWPSARRRKLGIGIDTNCWSCAIANGIRINDCFSPREAMNIHNR